LLDEEMDEAALASSTAGGIREDAKHVESAEAPDNSALALSCGEDEPRCGIKRDSCCCLVAELDELGEHAVVGGGELSRASVASKPDECAEGSEAAAGRSALFRGTGSLLVRGQGDACRNVRDNLLFCRHLPILYTEREE